MASNFRPRGKRIRPRVICHFCDRSIAITFNKRNGDAYVRSHTSEPGTRCEGSQKTIIAPMVHMKIEAADARERAKS